MVSMQIALKVNATKPVRVRSPRYPSRHLRTATGGGQGEAEKE